MIFVDGILTLRALQPDGDFLLRLIDLEIVAEGLKSGRDDLYPQHAERNAVEVRLALGIRLQLESGLHLLLVFSHGMQYHGGIANRFAAIVLEDNEVRRRGKP